MGRGMGRGRGMGWARLALAVGGLGLGLLLAEGGMRLSGQDPMDRILQVDSRNPWNDECFELDEATGYRYRPGLCGTNRLGFPEPERPAEKQPGEKVVLVLGDSIAADRMFPAFAEQIWRSKPGGSTVDVVNTGVPGYATRNALATWQRWADDLQPDAVILQFCLNDYTATPFLFRHQGRILKVEDGAGSLWGRSAWWFAHSALYRNLTLHADIGRPAPIEERFAGTEQPLLALQQETAARSIPLLVVVFPYLDDPTRWPEEEQRAYRRILSFLAESGIDHIDLTPAFSRGGLARLQRHHAASLFQDLPATLDQWQIAPDHAAWLERQDPNLLKLQVPLGQPPDPVHPGFLGHAIAAWAITDRLSP